MVGLSFREQLDPVVANELDALITQLQAILNASTTVTSTTSSITTLTAAVAALTASVSALSSAAERTANKGQVNGYAGLDASGRLTARFAPTSTTNSTTGAQNNLDFSSADALLFTNATGTTVSGLLAGYTGETVIVMANGAGTVTLANNSGSSSAGNKFTNNSGADLVLAAGTGRAMYRYSGAAWVQLW